MSNDKPAPTDAQILAACEEAGLWPNTAASWVANGAFARYHAAINRMLAAEAEKQAGPVAYLWQHSETGRTRVVMPDQVWTAEAYWAIVGPLYLHPSSDNEDAERYRQWFETVQDLNGAYLNDSDYKLAASLYKSLGMRVPNSVAARANR